MDLQDFINNMNEQHAKDRSNYHLTYGQLIEALEKAPANAVFDERIKGIGSWRGSYIEIALYTKDSGYHAEKEEFNDYGGDTMENYNKWEKENVITKDSLPTNANELAKELKSLLGLQFVGYKGGNYTIEEYKPLWLEEDSSAFESVAIVGIDKDLKLVTKKIED